MKRAFLFFVLISSVFPASAIENVYFHVTDEYGYPVPDALITVVDFQKVRTDIYGNAGLTLSRTYHTIMVSKPGYATYMTHFYVVGTHTLYVTLKKSKISILFAVRDIFGNPIPSVLVSAGNMADLSQNSTDGGGMALLFIPKGAYIVTAQKEWYEVAEKRGVIENSMTMTLYMNRKGMNTIAGAVTMHGKPIPFVDVEVVPENGSYSYRVRTDAQGRFVVEVLKYGTYMIVIPKFGKVVKNIEPRPGLPAGIVVSVG